MPPAIIGAGIGAVGAIGGSVLGSKAQTKAANQASDSAAQVAAQNNQLAREVDARNRAALDPFVGRGNAAGDTINALLGLGGSGSTGGPQQQQLPQQQFSQFGGIPNPAGSRGFDPREPIFGSDFAPQGGGFFGGYPGFQVNQPQTTQPAAVQTPESQQEAADRAFDIFRNSSGFQFRQQQGNDSVNTGFAARGALRSGAALKSLADFNQNIASNEFGNYLGQLSNQQGIGFGAASASAGVGQNLVSNISRNNDSAGTAAANAALIKGQGQANLYGGIGNALGTFASSF